MALSCSDQKKQQDQAPNVLLIAVDDLNDWVGWNVVEAVVGELKIIESLIQCRPFGSFD